MPWTKACDGVVDCSGAPLDERECEDSLSVDVSSAPDCSRTFRIKVNVKNIGDPSRSAFVVHVPNSITAAIP